MSKQRYIWSGGEKIFVSEELYRAYYRPVWREAKQRGTRGDAECSLDALYDNGFEATRDEQTVEEIVSERILLDELRAALGELSDDERSLIDALFYQEKTERDFSAENGIPQTTIHYRKKRILGMLQKKLKNT